MGGAAARPVDLDDLRRVAGSYRPRRTDTEGSVSLGGESVGRHLPTLPEVRRRSLHAAHTARWIAWVIRTSYEDSWGSARWRSRRRAERNRWPDRAGL